MAERDIDSWMWAEACEMLEQAERMHRRFFTPSRAPTHRPTWEPPVDVFEDERTLLIIAALPGVEPDNLEVSVEGGSVVVAGVRPIPAAAHTAALRRMEIPHGRFERRIPLAAGRYEIGRRELANGCLVLSLTKL